MFYLYPSIGINHGYIGGQTLVFILVALTALLFVRSHTSRADMSVLESQVKAYQADSLVAQLLLRLGLQFACISIKEGKTIPLTDFLPPNRRVSYPLI